jgi:hypothetical protein
MSLKILLEVIKPYFAPQYHSRNYERAEWLEYAGWRMMKVSHLSVNQDGMLIGVQDLIATSFTYLGWRNLLSRSK